MLRDPGLVGDNRLEILHPVLKSVPFFLEVFDPLLEGLKAVLHRAGRGAEVVVFGLEFEPFLVRGQQDSQDRDGKDQNDRDEGN